MTKEIKLIVPKETKALVITGIVDTNLNNMTMSTKTISTKSIKNEETIRLETEEPKQC